MLTGCKILPLQEEIDRARVRGEAPAPHLLQREAGWHASIDEEVSVMLAGAAQALRQPSTRILPCCSEVRS